MLDELINFLQSEFKISVAAISLAKKTYNVESHTLPIVLWQYGLLDTEELNQVFDWLEVC